MDNCFTEFCGFLSYINKNQPQVHPKCPPFHLPPHCTLQPVTEPLFEFPESQSRFPLAIYFTHGIVNFYVTLSTHLPFSLLSSHLDHRSVLYVCFSTVALKINSCVISSDSIYVSVYDIYISLIDLLHCIMGSSFMHLIRTDSDAFLLWLSSISLYICTTASLFIHLSMDIQVVSMFQLF